MDVAQIVVLVYCLLGTAVFLGWWYKYETTSLYNTRIPEIGRAIGPLTIDSDTRGLT